MHAKNPIYVFFPSKQLHKNMLISTTVNLQLNLQVIYSVC